MEAKEEKAAETVHKPDDQVTTEYLEYEVRDGSYAPAPSTTIETTRVVNIDSGEYGGGDYLRSLYANLVRGNGHNRSSISTGAKSIMQEAILNSRAPLPADESSSATVRVGGVDITGTWINRDECLSWRGPIPLEKYKINTSSATIINKNLNHTYDQIQNISVKYLKPPPLPPAGDIIIKHEPDVQLPPAPPIIIRQHAAAVKAPPPKILRERPPRQPAPVPASVIPVPGKIHDPPERQVIVERMPAAAPLPQDVAVERWLGYPRQKRRVVQQKQATAFQPAATPKNILIDWNSTNNTRTHQKINFLGIENADPEYYERKYGAELVSSERLPLEANEANARLPRGEELAIHQTPKEFVLEGDVEALNLVDSRTVNLNDFLVPKWLFKH